MTIDRQIVLMLVIRSRVNYRTWKHLSDNVANDMLSNSNNEGIPNLINSLEYLYAQYIESRNAAEQARRILYGSYKRSLQVFNS